MHVRRNQASAAAASITATYIFCVLAAGSGHGTLFVEAASGAVHSKWVQDVCKAPGISVQQHQQQQKLPPHHEGESMCKGCSFTPFGCFAPENLKFDREGNGSKALPCLTRCTDAWMSAHSSEANVRTMQAAELKARFMAGTAACFRKCGVQAPRRAQTARMDAGGAFAFVHIPKCAGATVVSVLRDILPVISPGVGAAGSEVCLQQGIQAFRPRDPDTSYIVFLRSPRHHVWSQYTECRFDKWGVSMTREYTDFPRDDQTPLVEGFGLWVDHYYNRLQQSVGVPRPEDPWYGKITKNPRVRHSKKKYLRDQGCYHPENMQSRYLSQQAAQETFMQDWDLNEGHSQDNSGLTTAAAALVALHTQVGFVGFVEFMDESYCLLAWELDGIEEAIAGFDGESRTIEAWRSWASTGPVALRHFRNTCSCVDGSLNPAIRQGRPDLLPAGFRSDTRVTHHENGHGDYYKNQNMTAQTVEHVDRLTAHDRNLFLFALKDFFGRAKRVEAKIGHRFVCPAALRSKDDLLGYLAPDGVEELYNTA